MNVNIVFNEDEIEKQNLNNEDLIEFVDTYSTVEYNKGLLIRFKIACITINPDNFNILNNNPLIKSIEEDGKQEAI